MFNRLRSYFFPGKSIYLFIIAFIISAVGIIDSFKDVNGERLLGYLPYVAIVLVVLAFSIYLLKTKDLKQAELLARMFYIIFVSALPLIVLNALFFLISCMLPGNQEILQLGNFHYWWNDPFWMNITLFLLISYIVQLFSGLFIFIVIILPTMLFLKPEVITAGSNLERVKHKGSRFSLAFFVYIGIALNFIGPLLAVFTRGFSEEIIFKPLDTWTEVKWLFAQWQYGNIILEDIIWVIGVFLTFLGVAFILFAIITIIVINVFFKGKVITKKVGITAIVIALIGVVAVFAQLFMKNGQFTSKEIIEFKEDLVFEERSSFEMEKTELDKVLAYVDDIKFPKLEIMPEKDFALQKSSVIPSEPDRYHIYLFDLTHPEIEKVNFSFNVYETSSTYESAIEKATDEYVMEDGTTVYLKREDPFVDAYYEDGGKYYHFTAHILTDGKLEMDRFIELVEEIGTDDLLRQQVKEYAEKTVEKQFVMPTYFPKDMQISQVEIRNDGLLFSYRIPLKTEGERSEITNTITYEVGSKPFYQAKESGSKKIELADGTAAKLFIAYDYPVQSSPTHHQNVIFFDKDGHSFQVHTTNIERPMQSKEVERLKEITNSIELFK